MLIFTIPSGTIKRASIISGGGWELWDIQHLLFIQRIKQFIIALYRKNYGRFQEISHENISFLILTIYF